jgi:hypothetical protein
VRTSADGSSSRTSSMVIDERTINTTNNFDANQDRSTDNYKFLLDAFLMLLQREHNQLAYVFPQTLQSVVFTKLLALPLNYMLDEGKNLCRTIENLAHKLDTGKFAIYGLFSILKWLQEMRPKFDQLYAVTIVFLFDNLIDIVEFDSIRTAKIHVENNFTVY